MKEQLNYRYMYLISRAERKLERRSNAGGADNATVVLKVLAVIVLIASHFLITSSDVTFFIAS